MHVYRHSYGIALWGAVQAWGESASGFGLTHEQTGSIFPFFMQLAYE